MRRMIGPIEKVIQIPRRDLESIKVYSALGFNKSNNEIQLNNNLDFQMIFFRGYAIFKDHFINSTDSFNTLFSDENDISELCLSFGSFSTFFYYKKKFHFVSDINGLEPSFIYEDDSYIYLSTSFLFLVETLIDHGQSLSIDHEISERFLSNKNVYDTLFLSSTLIDGIKLIPYSTRLEIVRNNGQQTCKFISIKYIDILTKKYNYEKLLVLASSRIKSLIIFASKYANTVLISLSGGSDSRLTYAISNKIGLKNSYVLTAKRGTDIEIAKQLVRLTDDTLHSKFPYRHTTSLKTDDALRFYELSDLGVYYLGFPSQVRTLNPFEIIEIRGGGGGTIRPPYTENSLSGLSNLDETDAAFFNRDINYIPNKLTWEDMHNFYFRNRIHFGRTYTQGFSVCIRFDPLMAPELQAAASLQNYDERYNFQIYHDFLLLNNPVFAFIPYDQQNKNIQLSSIKNYTLSTIDKNISFEKIQSVNCSCSPPKNKETIITTWLSSDDFNAQVMSLIVDKINKFLPFIYKTSKKRDFEYYFKKNKVNYRKQILKYYALARLIELGVSEFDFNKIKRNSIMIEKKCCLEVVDEKEYKNITSKIGGGALEKCGITLVIP